MKAGRGVVGLVDQSDGVFDSVDHLTNVEWLLEVAIKTVLEQVLSLAIGELTTHCNDLCELQVSIALDELEDIFASEVGQVHIEEHDVRTSLFACEACFETRVSGVNFVVGLFGEHFLEHFDDFAIVINDEYTGLARLEAIEWDVVYFHEFDEGAKWDTTVFGAGDAISLKLT